MGTQIKINRTRLHIAAAAAGVTFTDISRSLGIAPPTFSDKTRGRRSWLANEIEQLENILGVSIIWLTGDEKDGAI
jgi:hypothetical protein